MYLRLKYERFLGFLKNKTGSKLYFEKKADVIIPRNYNVTTNENIDNILQVMLRKEFIKTFFFFFADANKTT